MDEWNIDRFGTWDLTNLRDSGFLDIRRAEQDPLYSARLEQVLNEWDLENTPYSNANPNNEEMKCMKCGNFGLYGMLNGEQIRDHRAHALAYDGDPFDPNMYSHKYAEGVVPVPPPRGCKRN